jgi:hypothetical protein
MWVIDLKVDVSKVLIYPCPQKVQKMIMAASKQRGTGVYDDPSHPKTGRPIWLDRVGTKMMDTDYTQVELDEKPWPLVKEHAAQRKKFIDVLVIPTYEEVKEAGLKDGGESGDEYDSEENNSSDELDDLDRTQLKRLLPGEGLKKNNAEFIVYKTTTNDEIREYLRKLLKKEEAELADQQEGFAEEEDPESGFADDETTTHDDLGRLDRKELKKLLPGEGKKELKAEWIVYTTTTDDEIRDYLRTLVDEMRDTGEEKPKSKRVKKGEKKRSPTNEKKAKTINDRLQAKIEARHNKQ